MQEDTQLKNFCSKVTSLINNHHIVQSNAYTYWFSQGNITLEELQYFAIQFSIFNHLFVEAQLRKCINALSSSSYRIGKEILLNELSTGFSKSGAIASAHLRFETGHFEWFANFARHLNLNLDQIGKRSYGNESTIIFCNTLLTHYGSTNPSIAAGASYAIEYWAATGFWKQLISGLKQIKRKRLPDLPLNFWIWQEEQYAIHTNDELAKIFYKNDFSQADFIEGVQAMLNAIAIFWEGLESNRKQNQAA